MYSMSRYVPRTFLSDSELFAGWHHFSHRSNVLRLLLSLSAGHASHSCHGTLRRSPFRQSTLDCNISELIGDRTEPSWEMPPRYCTYAGQGCLSGICRLFHNPNSARRTLPPLWPLWLQKVLLIPESNGHSESDHTSRTSRVGFRDRPICGIHTSITSPSGAREITSVIYASLIPVPVRYEAYKGIFSVDSPALVFFVQSICNILWNPSHDI